MRGGRARRALAALGICHNERFAYVRANILSPWPARDGDLHGREHGAEQEYYRDSIGIGEPEGVVPTLLYLISDASENLTGVVIEQRIISARERTAH